MKHNTESIKSWYDDKKNRYTSVNCMHMAQVYLQADIVLFSQTRQTHIMNLKEHMEC